MAVAVGDLATCGGRNSNDETATRASLRSEPRRLAMTTGETGVMNHAPTIDDVAVPHSDKKGLV
jgi:hypothetical protein